MDTGSNVCNVLLDMFRDGTKGFLRGEQYAVCLALIVDGKVQLAVQGCPNLPRDLNDPSSSRGSLFIAVRGEGSFEVDSKKK